MAFELNTLTGGLGGAAAGGLIGGAAGFFLFTNRRAPTADKRNSAIMLGLITAGAAGSAGYFAGFFAEELRAPVSGAAHRRRGVRGSQSRLQRRRLGVVEFGRRTYF